MATKKKTSKRAQWYEDGDDAWFGPAGAKRNPKKERIGVAGKGHPAVKVTHKAAKKPARKRVAGK